jgi:hypothetical protein
MNRVSTRASHDPRMTMGPSGPILRATPPGNLRVHDQDDGMRATRDDPQGSRFQTQGPASTGESDFPADADASYDGYGAYAALDGSRVDDAEFADLDNTGRLLESRRGTVREDEAVLDDVLEVLAADPSLRTAFIDVTVDRGEVWLHGHVTRRAYKRLAEDLSYRVDGVLDVHNRLRVTTSYVVERPERAG